MSNKKTETLDITENPELVQDFIRIYCKLSKSNHLNSQNLQGKTIKAIFKENEMVGGYVISTLNSLQYLDALPNKVKEDFNQNNYPLDECVEITSIWYNVKMTNTLGRCLVIAHSVYDAFKTKRKCILGGSHIKPVMISQMYCLPNLIHNGLREFDGSEKEYWVYYGRRSQLFYSLPRMLWHMVKKDLRRKISKFNSRKERTTNAISK